MSVLSLKTQIDFDKVFKEGQRINGRLFNLAYIAGVQRSRLGIVVNKKFGGAVVRNRAKRRFREAFSRLAGTLKIPVEVVILPKQGAEKADFESLVKELRAIAEESGLL